jgi:putative polyhydroxyalkanoic acid system protein
MSNLTAKIPHRLTRAEVKQRLQDQIILMRQQGGSLADIQESWTGDVMHFAFRTMGQNITGELRIADDFVFLDIAFPWFLSMIANAAKATLEQKVKHVLTDQSKRDPTPKG